MISEDSIKDLLERADETQFYNPMDRHELQREIKKNQVTIMKSIAVLISGLNELEKKIGKENGK